MKKIIIFSSVSIVICAGIVFLLYAFKENPVEEMNGFVRNERGVYVELEKSLGLTYSAYYFAGATKDSLYLGNSRAAGRLLSIDMALDSINRRNLSFQKPVKYAWEISRIAINDSSVFLKEGVSPTIFEGDIKDLVMRKEYDSSCYFSDSWTLSKNSMIAKTILASEGRNVLVKITKSSPFVKFNTDALVKQVDGIFCTEGTMAFDSDSNYLVYTYYHRNEFIKLDTNLNVVLLGHTIDTNKVAKITVSETTNEGNRLFSSPPKYVNLITSASSGKLYVLSNLLADNNERRLFRKYSIVDEYSTSTGRYIRSIYLPRYRRENIFDFKVIGNSLYAIYNNSICLYRI